MTRAVILAAGQGIRLRPYTDEMPKCLVPYQGRSILDYTLATLRECGIRDISVVGGYRIDVLRAHLDGQDVTVYSNDAYDRTNMVVSLFCAEPVLHDDVIICYGDIVFGADILMPLVACPDEFAVTSSVNWRQLWQKRMPDPLADAETFQLDSAGYVRELGLKPTSFDDVQGQYMGLIKVRATAWPRVAAAYRALAEVPGRIDKMFMTEFLQHLIGEGLRLKAVPVTGAWMEIDTLDDLRVRY